jgi:Vitamin K-dependent gamma-carboxylase
MEVSGRSALTVALSAWERYWFKPIPPHIYALLRIGFGVSGLAILVIRADLSLLWDLDQGLVPFHRGWVDLKTWLLVNDPTGLAGRVAFLSSSAIFLAMTLGLWTRVTVPLSFAAVMLQFGWNSLPMSGGDLVLRVFLFCLLWTDCGTVWSLDARRARRRQGGASDSPHEWPAIAPLRLIRFQLALIYLSAGLWKLGSDEWRDGSAVYYVLNSNLFQRFPGVLTADFAWITTGATYGTLFWELAFAPMVLFKPTRNLALILGVLIHVGMFLTMEVGAFHLVMLAAYPAFLDPNRVPALAGMAWRVDKPVNLDHSSVSPAPRIDTSNPH